MGLGKILGNNAGGLIGGAFSLIQGGLDRKAAIASQERSSLENRKAVDLQYQRSIQDWNRQNAYNDPSQQMQRLKDAGLNPNLVYGSGSPANTATSAPKSENVKMDYQIPSGIQLPQIQQFQDMQLKRVQMDNVAAQTDNTKARTFNEGLNASLKRLGILTQGFNLDRSKGLYPYQLEAAGLKNNQLSTNIMKNLAAIELARQQKLNAEQINTNLGYTGTGILLDNEKKRYDRSLNKSGLNSTDPWYMRTAKALIDKMDRTIPGGASKFNPFGYYLKPKL